MWPPSHSGLGADGHHGPGATVVGGRGVVAVRCSVI